MKLQEFVSETLREIIDGVKEVQKHAEGQGAVVNPGKRRLIRAEHGGTEVAATPLAQEVVFDVALTTTEEAKKQGGGGVLVAGVGFGGKASADTSQMHVSRVQFSVHVQLPTAD